MEESEPHWMDKLVFSRLGIPGDETKSDVGNVCVRACMCMCVFEACETFMVLTKERRDIGK